MYQGGCKAKGKTLNNTFVQYYETLESLLERMQSGGLFPEGATILVKASHSMGFSRLVDMLRDGSLSSEDR